MKYTSLFVLFVISSSSLSYAQQNTVLESDMDNGLVLKDLRAGTNWNYIEWQFNDGARDWVLGRVNQNGFFTLFRHGLGQTLTVNNSGYLGIGTAQPANKLDIIDNAPKFRIRANANGREITLDPGNGNIDGNDGLHLNRFSNAKVMIALGGGNVGIGTTSPGSKLTVKGNIHAEEVKVDLNVPGPDYVFAKDYDLPSLESISTYIEANQHLPEIPSAKEMEQNGIDLGVMNMLLLKKVEELTLHLIEQDGEIKEMKKLIGSLQHEIESKPKN